MRGDKHGAPMASVVDRATVERTWLLARANMGALRARGGPERSSTRDCCEIAVSVNKSFFKTAPLPEAPGQARGQLQ